MEPAFATGLARVPGVAQGRVAERKKFQEKTLREVTGRSIALCDDTTARWLRIQKFRKLPRRAQILL